MRVAKLVETWDLEVRTTLFPLHPDTPEEGLTLERLFGGRMDVDAAQAQMRKRMQDEGLPYGPRTHTYNSRRAQELAKWAEAAGTPLHDALYRTYFVEGRNLAQVEVLVDVAVQAGLPDTEARDAVVSGDWAAAVDEDWARSRALGVTGVPTFVMDGYGVVGAQPYAALEELVRHARGDAA